jgi:methylsterol monooxygenase
MGLIPDDLAGFWAAICVSYEPGKIEWVGSTLLQIMGFLVPGLILTLFDLLQPLVMPGAKIQRQDRQPSKRQIVSCLGLVLFNHAYLMGSHFFLLSLLEFKFSIFRMDPRLPSVREVATHCVVGALIRDFLFYYVHRLMHTKRFYRLFHSTHHSFRAPIALAAVYSHTVDHSLQNAMPIYVPMALQRAHFLTLLLFAGTAVLDAAVSHSGYALPRLPSVQNHDIHHEKGNVNFGVLGLMDWLHGTHASQVLKS